MKLIVTGGAGFIGSEMVRYLLSLGHEVINIDKLTYSGGLDNLASVCNSPNYHFASADICDFLRADRPAPAIVIVRRGVAGHEVFGVALQMRNSRRLGV